jgi:hypothetical protein
MPSLAIYGDSGMGKTMTMKRFRDQHPPSFNPITGKLKTPVQVMEMTSRPGEWRFYAELLTLLGAPSRRMIASVPRQSCFIRRRAVDGLPVIFLSQSTLRLADHLPALRKNATDHWRV